MITSIESDEVRKETVTDLTGNPLGFVLDVVLRTTETASGFFPHVVYINDEGQIVSVSAKDVRIPRIGAEVGGRNARFLLHQGHLLRQAELGNTREDQDDYDFMGVGSEDDDDDDDGNES